MEAGHLDLILAKRRVDGLQGELVCRQKMIWVGDADLLGDGRQATVPLVMYPQDALPREVILDCLRRAGRRWSIRFEGGSYASLRAATLAGLGVTAFGLGMIPAGLRPLPDSALPALDDVEYTLARSPTCTDQVVLGFYEILQAFAPRSSKGLLRNRLPLCRESVGRGTKRMVGGDHLTIAFR